MMKIFKSKRKEKRIGEAERTSNKSPRLSKILKLKLSLLLKL